ncbi:MAG: SRPBCC domain-containing protein [Promethearchaeota archaeon]
MFTESKARIKDEVGSKFSLGDGYIKGKNIELIPNEKIVQEWQADEAGWPKTHFSVITIDLVDKGDSTILNFKQTRVPSKCYEDIAEGWQTYYWKPLKLFLEHPEEFNE